MLYFDVIIDQGKISNFSQDEDVSSSLMLGAKCRKVAKILM